MNINELTQRIKNGPKLISLTPLHRYGEEAKALGEEASGRADVPDLPNLPRHLKDYVPTFRTTKSGGSMAGIATAEDFEGLATSPASIVLFFLTVWTTLMTVGLLKAFAGFDNVALLYMTGIAAFALASIVFLVSIAYAALGGSIRTAVSLFLGSVFLSSISGYMLAAKYFPDLTGYVSKPTVVILAFLPYLWLARKGIERGHKLIFQSRKNGGGKAILKLQGADERMAQAKQAIKEEKLPHVLYGETLGVLSKSVLSPWVCDPGLPLKASIPTLSLHTQVFGSSGAGKSKFLLGMISQVYESHGMFLSDYKAALPYEAKKAEHLIVTEEHACNMIHGISPSELNTFFRSVKKVDGSHNAIFDDNGLKIELSAHSLLKATTDKIGASNPSIFPRVSLSDGSGAKRNFTNNIGGLQRLVEALGSADTRKAYLSQFTNLLDQEIEREKGVGELSEALNYFTSLNSVPVDQVGSYFSNAQSLFLDFFTDKSLAAWAESEIPPVNFEKCFTEKFRVGVAIGDIQGATGIMYLAMFHQRFKKIAKQLAQEVALGKRTPESINDVLYVIDECASVFQFDKSDGLGDEQMVSIFRSLKVKCIFACQSASQLIGRFSEAKMNAFFSNIASIIVYDTKEPATYQLIANRVGKRPRIKRQNANTTSIDFAETYNQKAGNAIYDLANPNREAMLSLTGPMGVKSGYAWGKVEVPEFPIVTQTLESQSGELALDLETYTRWIQSPRVAFASVYVSGGYRQDFIKPYAVDENFEPYEIKGNETDANLEIAKALADADKARKFVEAGDYFAAAQAVEEAI